MDTQDAILVDEGIRALMANGALSASKSFTDAQLQPASLDLRLGAHAHRVRCGFLSESGPVAEKLEDLTLYRFDIREGGVLETGQIYVLPLLESLALPHTLAARANPKSTTGRLDIFTRLLTDRNPRFDDVPAGYRGPLWLEVSPRSFPIKVRAGDTLNQIRFFGPRSEIGEEELRALYRRHPLAFSPGGHPLSEEVVPFDTDGSITFSIGLPSRGIVGYRAKQYGGVVDLRDVRGHDPGPFFDPVEAHDGKVVIEPEKFYIFASRERVLVPPDHAAEMIAYDVGIGELRTNYAGFFDCGFGWTGGFGATGESAASPAEGRPRPDLPGTPAILEVRAHDVPFLIEDGQPVFRLRYFRTSGVPKTLYGSCGSSYARQTLDLAKQFRRVTP